MNENLRQITDEINRRSDEVEAIEDVSEWFDAHMQACAAASSALEALTDADLIEVIQTQSAERPDPLSYHPQDSHAAREAAGVLSLRHYRRAQKADTTAILEELAPLTDYRDPAAAFYRPEGREGITAPDALRREALLSVLTDRYDAALDESEGQAETSNPRRDQAAAICQAAERQVRT